MSEPDYVQVELSYKLLDRSIYSNIKIKPSTEEGKEMMEDKKGNVDVNNINIIGDLKKKK